MKLRQYWVVVWKWMWLILLATGLAAAGSLYASRQMPKVYQAATTLMVGPSIRSPNSQDITTSQQLAQTYVQMARTELVLQGVINALRLQVSPDDLRGAVGARLIQGTQLVELTYSDTDPRRAQTIVNELARQLILRASTSRVPSDANRREFIQKQVDEMQKKIEDATQKLQELQNSPDATSGARDIADRQQQIAGLQSQVLQWQQTFANLMSVLTPLSPDYLSIIDPARTPSEPTSPNIPLNVTLAAVVGMLLATGAVFLIEHMGDAGKSVEDVPKSLGLTVLGTIGQISGEGDLSKLVAAKHPRSSFAQAFRTLRTNVQVADIDRPIKTLLVASANPVEGRSVTVANLGVAMAQAGLRTLVVDADMRRPTLHNLFSRKNDYGLTESLLQSTPTLEGFVHSTEVENLSLLPTGQLPPNPAELLASRRMRGLLDRIKEEQDVAIFDTPPCLPVADAAILARMVDGVLLVVDADKTRQDAALRAKDALTRAGGRILGVVLNRASGASNRQYDSEEGQRIRKSSSKPRIGSIASVARETLARRSRNDNA